MFLTQKKIAILTLVLYWPMLLVLAHVPVPESVQNFLAYLVLTFLLWFSIKPKQKVNWRKAAPWLLLVLITGYSAADEIVQSYVGRNCDAMDVAANFSGVVFGLTLLTFLNFVPAAFIISGIVIFGMANVSKTNLADIFPVADAIFNFFSYAIFTVFWLLNMNLFLQKKLSKIKRLILTAGLPLFYLVFVRVIAFFLGREIKAEDIIAPIAAIVIVVCIDYLRIFLFIQAEQI